MQYQINNVRKLKGLITTAKWADNDNNIQCYIPNTKIKAMHGDYYLSQFLCNMEELFEEMQPQLFGLPKNAYLSSCILDKQTGDIKNIIYRSLMIYLKQIMEIQSYL